MSSNINFLPEKQNKNFNNMINNINESKNLIEEVKLSRKNFNDYSINYKPLHTKVRNIEKNIYKKLSKIEKIKKEIRLETELNEIQKFEEEILELENEIEIIKMSIPLNWKEENDNGLDAMIKFKEIIIKTFKESNRCVVECVYCRIRNCSSLNVDNKQ